MMDKIDDIGLMWFRRDLRLTDNASLYQALNQHTHVVAVFVFDTTILSDLPRNDRRVTFIYNSLLSLKEAIVARGGTLLVVHDRPEIAIPEIAQQFNVHTVYAGEDYEPVAIERDKKVALALAKQGRHLVLVKDQVIFAKNEILSQKGEPFTVFTPYKNAWLKALTDANTQFYDVDHYQNKWLSLDVSANYAMPTLSQIGFDEQTLVVATGEAGAQLAWQDFQNRIHNYAAKRDFPAIKGGSYLSVHLRFGTISIRQLVAHASMDSTIGAMTWLSELIWREFYMQFLYHHPNVVHEAYKAAWRDQPWSNDPTWFNAWCSGQTGYPIVDAAMRQLNQTGFMHNRLRMIAAAFLVKDLDINWQWGERYFAQQLLDFDLSANNGGWQWAASTGCDAAQPFRIFNPILQSERFDPQGKFICKYIPELQKFEQNFIHTPWLAPESYHQLIGFSLGVDYPIPIVDHSVARQKALDKYSKIKALTERNK
jgi:deoxyribodipyrimidine photo-lyase